MWLCRALGSGLQWSGWQHLQAWDALALIPAPRSQVCNGFLMALQHALQADASFPTGTQ
eukprot:CAMPEP_0172910270 /NCGR_PEP_ID=MMETSP1075-20121228/184330_1 /TAXON_ID=2916 /ORGANISM="Ceratium fusus, Strain PA161109" /LENGTH=58 /DNA_ID=CAMNT_0013768381 /DNA_START=52 /DNA_END=228 /DNA_ORIENTATION=+